MRPQNQQLKMRALVTLLTLLLLQYDSTCGATDLTYLVAVTSQAVSGTTETLCAHIQEPSTTISLVVTLSSDKENVTLLKENFIKRNFYKCVPFQVPVVLVDTVATVYVKIEGASTPLDKTTRILIKPPMKLILIQTDKPIYKPGETVKFRIVSLDTNFLTRNQKDPNSNRIGQWLNRPTQDGILDLFYRMTPQAAEGNYVITAWDEKNQETTQYFEIKGYVLPKFEVNANLPPVITPMNKEFMLNICALYTYGKGVQGSLTAEVCGTNYNYNWYRRSTPATCRNYVIKTEKTGCASQVINLTEYGMSPGGYLNINYKVEEDGTGITVEGSAGVSYSSDVITVSFVDTADVYKPGLAYEGKVLVTDVYNKPLKGQTVYLIVNYDFKSVNMTLTTDLNGTAYFSLDTTVWSGQPAYLQARHIEDKLQNDFWPAARSYISGTLSLRPFYSKSKSFLKLISTPNLLSCAIDANVEASYIIQGSALKKGQQTLDVFYMEFSKGSMAQNGRVSVNVQFGTENKGKLSFTLKTTVLSLFAQVVVYTVLPNGETVADSWNFPIEQCFPNKVSLSFSSSTALPKDTTALNLNAQPGSLCSVRSIDQSVLFLKPEAQHNAAFVFGMLPVQMLGDYPYQVWEDEDPCVPRDIDPIDRPMWGRGPIEDSMLARERRRPFIYVPHGNRNDAYSAFKAIGVKIATNSDVKELVPCYDYMLMRPAMETVALQPDASRENIAVAQPVAKSVQNSIRKFFPETWIWDLVPVGRSGFVTLTKTVPDTITKWATDAFCTSSVGFGVAPSTSLTAFQPFFVSLALPYSVIRGEELPLEATVFNYLAKCIMVTATLENSDKFSAQPCNGCIYTLCICAEEGKTFEWTVTASVLGEVKVTVRAETVRTRERCGNEVVTVPEGRRIDTVVQSFLVEAEGVKQIITQNDLICLTGNQVTKTVSLELPEVVVKDSEKSFVTVLGDLISHALKNIANLLRMPYGCGEQNMLNFAPNIYILQYLESSGQLAPEILERAKTYLQTGYQTELIYKHFDGSYSAFGNRDASGHTWLTAYVIKIFVGAKKYVFVDQTNIDQANNWLGQQQQENGCFKTVGILYHNDIKGGVSDDVTLTAYIVAALLEQGMKTTDPMVKQGLVCLKDASSNLNNTYFTALASYTFTLAGDQEMRQKLISSLDNQVKREGVGRYWTQTNNGQLIGSLEIEMSSYVLLALLSGPTLPSFKLDYSATIVSWLAKRQNAFGGFSSSQDTVVALQALAKYSAATYNPSGNVVVNVTSPSNQKYNFIVNQRNRLLYQERQLQPPTGDFTLATGGQGCVFVQFSLHYNVLPSNSLAFSIITDATSTCERKQYYTVTLALTVRYNGPREETNMVIINVKLLSGFVLDFVSLQALQQDSRIKLVEQDEGHVMLYLDGMKKEEKSFTLTLLQNVVVKNLKPAVVTVYDYYKTSEGGVKQYTSPCVT